MVTITFITPSGDAVEVEATIGESLMETAIKNDVEGIIAACGGCLACATCHAFVEEPWLSKLEAQSEPEKEMLEYASHVEGNSRLTCQIIVSSDLNGAIVRMPPSQD